MVAGAGKAVAKLVGYIVAYVAATAANHFLFAEMFSIHFPGVVEYKPYADILLAIGFGYMIVSSFSQVIYWFMRMRYEHPAAAAVRNVFKIIGIGALVAGIAGSISSPTAGVALGGFMGMVIGLASQQVLGQAMSGLLILIIRPFMITDRVEAAGEKGEVEDITVFFTVLRADDGKRILIPNNSLIGSKIIRHKREEEKE